MSSRFINFCQHKFNQLQTRQKILLGFSVPLLLMIVIATLVYFSIGKLTDDTKWVQHTHQVITDGQELAKLMIDMETGERGFLITGKESFLEPFEKAQKVWDSRISDLKLLVADNPVQILRLARVDSLEKEWLQKAAAIEIDKRRGVPETNKSLAYMQNVLRKKVGKNILDKIRVTISDINDSLEKSSNQQAVNLLLSLSTDIVDQETGQRGYLITGEEEFLEPYKAGQENFDKNMSALRRVLEGGFDKKRILSDITELETLAQRWSDEAAAPEIKMRDKESDSKVNNYKVIEQKLADSHGKDIHDRMRASLEKMELAFIKANIKPAQGLVIALGKDMVDQETAQRGYLITGKKDFLQPYDKGKKSLKNHFAKLRTLVSNNVSKKIIFIKLESLRAMVQEWRDSAAEPEIIARREIAESGLSTLEFLQSTLSRGRGKEILDDIRDLLSNIEQQFYMAGNVVGSNLVLKIAKAMVDQETGERGYLITGEENFLQPYISGQAAFDDAIIELRVLLKSALTKNALTKNVVNALLTDVKQVHLKGKEWLEKAAKPEIAARRRINKSDLQTLQYIQKVLVRGKGKNILDELRVLFAKLNQIFLDSNHLKASYQILVLKKAMVDQETGQRGYLITGDEEFLEPYTAGLANFRATIPKLKYLISNYYQISTVLDEIKEIEALATEWRDKAVLPEIDLRRQVNAGRAKTEQIEIMLGKGIGKTILDKIRGKLEKLIGKFELAQSETGQQFIAAIAKDMVDQETGQRGFLITGKESFLQPFVEGRESLQNHLDELRSYVSAGFDKQKMISEIEQVRLKAAQWRQIAAKPEIDIRRSINQRSASMNDVTLLIENETGKNIVDAIRKELAEFSNTERVLMTARVQDAEAAATTTIFVIIASTIMAISIALFVAFMVSNSLVRRLQILVNAIYKVTTGDFTKSIAIDSQDEIGRLGQSFNNMTTTLKLSREHMEKANQDLIIEKEKAELATHAKDSFLATMSHEIRTPMNGVLGMTQILADTKLSREQRDYVETINQSGNLLLDIINDILDFAKIEAGKLDIEPIPFDLMNAIMETSELFTAKCSKKGIELIVNYAPDLPQHFIGDPGRIRQILMNLLGNAVKFTEKGYVLLEITSLSHNKEEAHLSIAITDTGIGISEEVQKALFQPFTQADTSTTRRFGGTGLGLTICKQLIELMGGKISISSKLGKGTTLRFDLTLPISNTDTVQVPVDVDFSQLRLLVVDDNQINLDILSRQLSRWKIRTETVTSGAAAIARLKKTILDKDPFQIVLSDYQMPEMSGGDLIETIKADPLTEKTKFILLSSSGSRGDGNLFHKQGFSGYLGKPINLGILYKMICLLWDHIQNGTEPVQMITRHTISEAHNVMDKDTDADIISSKVLLVEDNIVNQKVAKKMLEKMGCNVAVAANGQECVEMQQQFSYDIVFMDCQMPVMDGFEATRALRDSEIGTDKHQLIIAMTANAIEGDRQNCIDQGMDDYISKPIDQERLHALLLKWQKPTSASKIHVVPESPVGSQDVQVVS